MPRGLLGLTSFALQNYRAIQNTPTQMFQSLLLSGVFFFFLSIHCAFEDNLTWRFHCNSFCKSLIGVLLRLYHTSLRTQVKAENVVLLLHPWSWFLLVLCVRRHTYIRIWKALLLSHFSLTLRHAATADIRRAFQYQEIPPKQRHGSATHIYHSQH